MSKGRRFTAWCLGWRVKAKGLGLTGLSDLGFEVQVSGTGFCGVKWFGKLMWASEGGQLHVISYGGVSNFVHDLQASRSSEI